MGRAFNFSAGPSNLPEPVLKKAAAEMVEYRDSGMSVMEMSHRSAAYEDIIFGCEALLREVMNIPDNYKVLFLQGGAWLQFSMIPMNLMTGSGKADYIITGQWAQKAYEEGKRYGDVVAVASSKDKNFTYIPEINSSMFRKDADYVHICYNNTIFGTAYSAPPDTGDIPLVADMSSCILSAPIDVSKFGIIYAGAQKNMGPAGVCTVIIREDLIGKAMPNTPTMLDYKTHADQNSLFNTPPAYSIYICKLVLEWLRDDIGGLAVMQERNRKKAAMLYDYLDSSKMFKATVQGEARSMMNVPFVTGDEALDKEFIKLADKSGLLNLKGYRAVGGMRASIYNAMPVEGIEALIKCMQQFEAAHQ